MSKDPVNFLLQEQVGMVVFNPTNENFDMQYSGVSFTLKSGEKQTLASNAARHVLNSFGPRGLCYLQFGADEGKVATEGRNRNEDFKRRQVVEFNIRNENRKNMNMGYIPATPKIKEYALELGLELMQPYAPRDAERVKINEQNEEIETLRKSQTELLEKVNMLIATLKGGGGTAPLVHTCEICGLGFSHRHVLEKHKRDGNHFPQKDDPVPGTLISQNMAEVEKPFICDACGASFSTNFALVGHTRSHKREL